MTPQVTLRDLANLILSRHAFIHLETREEERAAVILKQLAERLGLPFFVWTPAEGLRRSGPGEAMGQRALGSEDLSAALAHIGAMGVPGIYHFRELDSFLNNPKVISLIKKICEYFSSRKGALIVTASVLEMPAGLSDYCVQANLALPGREDHLRLLDMILKDVYDRLHTPIYLTGEEKSQLAAALSGLTAREAERALLNTILDKNSLSTADIPALMSAKKQAIEREGILEYYAPEASWADVADLDGIRGWLEKRRVVFEDREKAEALGLPFPKGILLLGVQGCGKSLCAKVVARSFGVPLLKLDTANLYQKYVGETEQNLRKALSMAEAMAPLVLWIDEIEKAFAGAADSGTSDGGLSKRIFGSFLSWLQEKKAGVFVVATANDIAQLPPELVRKGRFDEIFFVDLPDEATRQAMFSLHLKKKNQDPLKFDAALLAKASEGFSGAEIEQAVISALYASFSSQKPPATEDLLKEIGLTRPLSVIMAEKIQSLRQWSQGRTVSAH